MDFITVKVFPNTPLQLPYAPGGTVLNMIDAAAEKLSIDKERIKIIFCGKVLEKGFTMDYYKIKPSSKVTVFIEKQKLPKRETPKEMYRRLINLVNKLGQMEYKEFMETVHEVHRIAEDPILKKYAVINQDVERTIADALTYVDTAERPISTSTIMFLAKIQDNSFNQLESNIDGMHSLTETFMKKSSQIDSSSEFSDLEYVSITDSEYDEISDDCDIVFFAPDSIDESQKQQRMYDSSESKTVIDYTPKISTDPLPLPNKNGSYPFMDQCFYSDSQTMFSGVGNIERKENL